LRDLGVVNDLLPMLATPGVMPRGDAWAFEVKWDGVRALAFVTNGAVRLGARSGRDITRRYPELQGLADALAGRDAVLDGEIVACDDAGLPSFERLQERMHVDDPSVVTLLVPRVPVVYMVFDLVALDGDSLVSAPYRERRERLGELPLDGTNWHVPPNAIGDGSAMEAFTQERGIEGVVAKRLDSRYEPGRRSPAWRKVKHTHRQEFVIGGWTPGERGRLGDIGALVLGVYENDEGGTPRLRCCGKVGSGLGEDVRAQLRKALQPLARDSSPFAAGEVPRPTQFVEPQLVAEVKFAHWTSAHVVRAAVFLGVRTDKRATDVVRET
jgi:bifunctional non-homologous end joining protein LigD